LLQNGNDREAEIYAAMTLPGAVGESLMLPLQYIGLLEKYAAWHDQWVAQERSK
jgi:hypothetical protein